MRDAWWKACMFRLEVQSTKARPPVTSTSASMARAAAGAKPGSFGSGRPSGATSAAWCG